MIEPTTDVQRITEYAVRITYFQGKQHTREFNGFLRDAVNAYDHEVALHGEDHVEFMSRQVTRTAWVAGHLPPRVPAQLEPPDCEPQWERPSASTTAQVPVFVDLHLPPMPKPEEDEHA
jgi:hypothetical protein